MSTTALATVGPSTDLLELPRIDAHYLRSPRLRRLARTGAGGPYRACAHGRPPYGSRRARCRGSHCPARRLWATSLGVDTDSDGQQAQSGTGDAWPELRRTFSWSKAARATMDVLDHIARNRDRHLPVEQEPTSPSRPSSKVGLITTTATSTHRGLTATRCGLAWRRRCSRKGHVFYPLVRVVKLALGRSELALPHMASRIPPDSVETFVAAAGLVPGTDVFTSFLLAPSPFDELMPKVSGGLGGTGASTGADTNDALRHNSSTPPKSKPRDGFQRRPCSICSPSAKRRARIVLRAGKRSRERVRVSTPYAKPSARRNGASSASAHSRT